MAQPIVLKVQNLKKEFGKKVVLDNISLDIVRNEILGIIGMSGSGKTTLLNAMVGFLKPEEGDVSFQSTLLTNANSSVMESVRRNPKLTKKIFGFAPQAPSFYMQLTAEENLDHFGSLHGLSKDVLQKNRDHLIDLVELQNSRKVIAQNLSGGMQKRLGIACSLIHRPHILILDEPTADLDPILREEMWDLIQKINKKGTTIILASHFIDELETLCNRVGIIHNGIIAYASTPEKLKHISSNYDEINLKVSSGKYGPLMAQAKKMKDVSKALTTKSGLLIYTKNPLKTIQEITKKIERSRDSLVQMHVNKPSLVEVFEALEKK